MSSSEPLTKRAVSQFFVLLDSYDVIEKVGLKEEELKLLVSDRIN